MLMAKWAWLPQELLIITVERLEKLEDFVAFGAVCKSWHAAAKKEYFKGLWLRQRTPYLLLSGTGEVRQLYSLAEGEIVASVGLRNFSRRKCFESLGWLLAIGRKGSMCLLNPFSSTKVPVPHQSTIPGSAQSHPYEFVRKMVLSARPSENSNFVVVILYGFYSHIAFWRPGDTSWTCPEDGDFSYRVSYDVTYHDGHFYSFDNRAQVRMYDFVEDNPREGRIIARLRGYTNLEGYPAFQIDKLLGRRNVYIIKTLHTILLVARSFTITGDWYCRKTSKFRVLEFRMSSRSWRQIDNLGNMAIFVGSRSATTLVDASRFPGFIKANHIYFTNYGSGSSVYDGYGDVFGGNDIGAYDLKNGTIDPLYHGELLHTRLSPPTWITPCF